MYLKHFGLNKFPFSSTPDTDFFLDYGDFKDGLQTLKYTLSASEGIVKIIGEPGTGKTLLCQELKHTLDERFLPIHLSNPSLNPLELCQAVAAGLDIEFRSDNRLARLHDCIEARLLALHEEEKKVVLLIDEAQALSDKSLDTLRLLSNCETQKDKLLQIVLFAQPELDARLEQGELRNLQQRISFSHTLNPLSHQALNVYIQHRLYVAGNRGVPVFSSGALKILYGGSCGVPRLINVLAHKAMLVAFSRYCKIVEANHVRKAIDDTDSATKPGKPTASFFGLPGWHHPGSHTTRRAVATR